MRLSIAITSGASSFRLRGTRSAKMSFMYLCYHSYMPRYLLPVLLTLPFFLLLACGGGCIRRVAPPSYDTGMGPQRC